MGPSSGDGFTTTSAPASIALAAIGPADVGNATTLIEGTGAYAITTSGTAECRLEGVSISSPNFATVAAGGDLRGIYDLGLAAKRR